MPDKPNNLNFKQLVNLVKEIEKLENPPFKDDYKKIKTVPWIKNDVNQWLK